MSLKQPFLGGRQTDTELVQWGTDCTCWWLCLWITKKKTPYQQNSEYGPSSFVSALSVLTCHPWHVPHTCWSGRSHLLGMLFKVFTKPLISKIKAVNLEIVKKWAGRSEEPGINTFLCLLPGLWKHIQTCHLSSKSVIAQLSRLWWHSSSYNSLYYLMRCCLFFTLYKLFSAMKGKSGNSSLFP